MTSPERPPNPSYLARQARKRGDTGYLIGMLTDTEWLARASAAQELGKLGDSAGVEPLLRLLRADDDLLRTSVVKALAKIGDRSAVPALLDVATTDASSSVRHTAIDALASLGDPRGIEMLAQLAVDPSRLDEGADRTFKLSVTDNSQVPIDNRRLRVWALKRLRELHAVEAAPLLESSRPPRSLLLRLQFRRTLRALRS